MSTKYIYASLLLAAIMFLAPRPAGTQAPVQTGPAQGEEIMTDSSRGEIAIPLTNCWDGVDGDGNLHVPVMPALVLNDVGRMSETAVPCYPNFVDMNDDGLKDLVVNDTQGFVWIFQNSGVKGNPAFTTGKFVPTFIGWMSKIHVYDWDYDGDNDIVVGTFYGDIVILYNIGSSKEPRFARKMGGPRYLDPTFNIEDPQDRLPQVMIGKTAMVKGNYMSPWVCDWNKDGKPDLLLGEGTYSANSVRLLINSGSRNKPVFSEEREFYLAYGEGFEQLVPSVVDYNGDGLDDLIVGTRTGQIRLHKGTKKAIEGKDQLAAMQGKLQPAILEFDGNLKIAGKEVYDRMSAPYPCDWNEDGLFDLLLGSTSGKILIALNTGTKTEPKFDSVAPIKGTDVEKDALAPATWMSGTIRVLWHNFIGGFCNTASLLTCEKSVMLKSGVPAISPLPGAGEYFMYFRYVNHYPGWMINNLSWAGFINQNPTVQYVTGSRLLTPAQTFSLRMGRKYELSFSSVLDGKPAIWKFWAHETVFKGSDTEPVRWEHREVSGVIPPSTGWVKRSYKFKCPNTVQSNLAYNFFFRMPEGECKFLVDGLSLKDIGN